MSAVVVFQQEETVDLVLLVAVGQTLDADVVPSSAADVGRSSEQVVVQMDFVFVPSSWDLIVLVQVGVLVQVDAALVDLASCWKDLL